MKREMKILAAFAVLVGVILWFKDHYESIAFFLGALASSMAGFIGMYTATKANVRTTIAAYESGPEKDGPPWCRGPVHFLWPDLS